jgi:hypothetical protein
MQKNEAETAARETSVVALSPPEPGVSVFEPHVAIDPSRPDRMAVAAMYGVRGARCARSLYVWVSENEGASWQGARVVQPRGDGEGSADPIVAFATDGALLVPGMMVPKPYVDALESLAMPRSSIGEAGDMLSKIMVAFEHSGGAQSDVMFVARSEDFGRTFTGTVIGDSPGADKPAVAVDHHPDSPFAGSVYVAWQATGAARGMVHVARSTDGGRTFEAPVRVVGGPQWGPCIAQLVVRPDGSLHVVWTLMLSASEGAPPGVGDSVWHAVSHDGGKTFDPPVPIATHAGLRLIGIPALGVDPAGRMVVVWGQGTSVPDNPLAQIRHQLYVMSSADGVSWTAPVLACPDEPAATSMGLPAITSDGERWWILTYLADDTSTEVALLVSEDGGLSFKHSATLSRRQFGVDDIYLHGGYSLRFCDDVVQVGDYSAIAAAGPTLAATFVLPESDDPRSTTTAYVALYRRT